jgi:hypothetical protein
MRKTGSIVAVSCPVTGVRYVVTYKTSMPSGESRRRADDPGIVHRAHRAAAEGRFMFGCRGTWYKWRASGEPRPQ